MLGTKAWYQSKTIWAQIVSLIFMALILLGLLPEGLTEEEVMAAVSAVLSVAAIIFRWNATTEVGTPAPTNTLR
jgi:hypothetical protein